MLRRPFAAVAIAIAIALASLAAATPSHRAAAQGAPLSTGQAPLTYDGRVEIVPDSGSLRAHWRIVGALRPARGDSVTFRLNPGLHVERLSGPSVAGFGDTRSADGGGIVVHFRPGRATGADSIEIDYSGKPLLGDAFSGIGSRWVELGLDSYWHPIVDDLSHTITGRVAVVLPNGWRVIGGADRDDGERHVVQTPAPLTEIPFSAAPDLRDAGSGGVQVYYTGATADAVARTLDAASRCAGYLESLFAGGAQLPPLRIVLAPRRGPSYSRINYIVFAALTPNAAARLELTLCHEESHFWARGANLEADDWLNEGIANFIAANAVRRLSGDSLYERMLGNWRRVAASQPAVWTDTSTARPSAQVAYVKAPYILTELQDRIGEPAMRTILSSFLTRPVHTTPGLIDVVRDAAGEPAAVWLKTELARPAVPRP